MKTEQFLIALYSDSTDAVNDRFVPEAEVNPGNFNRKETMSAAKVYGEYMKYKHPIFTIPPVRRQLIWNH